MEGREINGSCRSSQLTRRDYFSHVTQFTSSPSLPFSPRSDHLLFNHSTFYTYTDMLFPYMPTRRPSSPLNPHTSSSPPSTMSYFSTGQSSPTPPSQHKTRYKRPELKNYTNSAPAELFAEGTTPTEAQMWRERFSRRMIDRERRRKGREEEVDKRRGPIHVEEDEAKALEDDEEVSPSYVSLR